MDSEGNSNFTSSVGGDVDAPQSVGGDVDAPQTPDEYAWMLHARCRGADPTEFFPSDGLGVEYAQRICAGCPVRVECLEYALVHRIEHGVWGGASERERRRILRRRRDLGPAPGPSASPADEPLSSS
jgi:WhiB family transcriptional regulator, redox-sensing transcriptional regulator